MESLLLTGKQTVAKPLRRNALALLMQLHRLKFQQYSLK